MKNWFGFIIVIGLIALALRLQVTAHLKPCPLCVMQRLAFIGVAFLFFIFAFLPKRLIFFRVQGLLLIIVASIGCMIAARQIYLQHLPADQVPACGPGLIYLLQTFSWPQVVSMVFQGSGECAVVDWRFFGLSMASWSFLWLLFFSIWGICLLRKKVHET